MIPPNVSCPSRIYSTLYFSRTEFTCLLIHTREYVLVNLLQLKLSVASNWQVNTFGVPFVLMLMVHLPDIFYIGHLRTCAENCFTQVQLK